MDQGFGSRAAAMGADGSGARVIDDKPPSTMAAQLVENLSTTKAARSDENNELKRLQTVIQKVIDSPDLLRTTEDRVEHNHLLIYVYARVHIDGIKLDDPFLDTNNLRSVLQKAINFLRFTIKETPSVLNYVPQGGSLLLRGRAPLWLWLLPQLLQLLGHDRCQELTGSIEGFLQYIQLITATHGLLWRTASYLGQYLRFTLTTMLDHLQSIAMASSTIDQLSRPLSILPPVSLDLVLGPDWSHSDRRTWYSLRRTTQIARQAISLSTVLAYPSTSSDGAFSGRTALADDLAWLLDAWLDLFQAEKRWVDARMPKFRVQLLELAMQVISRYSLDKDVNQLLRDKSRVLLVLCCSDLAASSDELLSTEVTGQQARRTYCKALIALMEACETSESIRRMIVFKLVDELNTLNTRYATAVSLGVGSTGVEHGVSLASLDEDLMTCIRLLHAWAGSPSPEEFNVTEIMFKDTEIGCLYSALAAQLSPRAIGQPQPSSKRRKLAITNTASTDPLISRFADSLGITLTVPDDLAGLEDTIVKKIFALDDSAKCQAIHLLSRLACEGAKDPAALPVITMDQCQLCEDCSQIVVTRATSASYATIQTIFTQIVQHPDLPESNIARIATMIGLRRIAVHSYDDAFLDLETPGAGQWCIQSLNSSLRELRIAAGRTLTAFLIQRAESANDELVLRNRRNTISILKSISEKDRSHLQETCILAWGQLGRVVDEDELNLVLIQLCDYLGSSNNLISAFAFNELLNLALARNTTPRKLFEPFWRSLAYLATKDMLQRPQRSRAIAELLQVSVNELLIIMQTHALPWLVLDKRKNTIQRIAEARGESDARLTLVDGPNLAAIMALLLVQEEPNNTTEFAKCRLEEASPYFRSLSVVDLFQSEPVLIVMELLKMAGDADASRKILIRSVLQRMATMVSAANKETKPKKGNVIGRFLQAYLLGLMARLTDVINDSTVDSPATFEQRRCIRALDQMIQFCGHYARDARPQISACLLSAISHEKLRQSALECWATMLSHLEEEDTEALLETTFYIITQYWSKMKTATKKIAHDMMIFLCDRRSDILARNAGKLPSLSSLEGLGKAEALLARNRRDLAPEDGLDLFCERIIHEHPGVVTQALSELAPYLRKHQDSLVATAARQRSDSATTSLLRKLLDCVAKYSPNQAEISRLCAECIGLIGCVDSNQVESVREQRSMVVLSNFQDSVEVTDFALFLIEVVLVPSFLSATDIKLQGFLSYAMQELLERCDVRVACAMQGTGMVEGEAIYRKWIALPDNIQEVVTPFLTSRYMVAQMEPITVEYPVFRPGRSYGNWLRSIVIDMLRKGQTAHAEMIFEPLTRVIRVKDLSTAEFLLPYLSLHIILGDRSTQQEKDNVRGELMSILQYRPSENATYQVKEDARRFYNSVFRVLNYASRWVQSQRSKGRLTSGEKQIIARIQGFLDSIPAELVSQRAVDCNEFSRALFYLEQHVQKLEQQERGPDDRTKMLERLQDIYANIDEPDGLDGISSHLQVLDVGQQVLSHKKAGRWTSAQTWYEMQLVEKPGSPDIQIELLNCLKQAGQHDVLLNHVEGMLSNSATDSKIMPFAVEAAWVTGRWEKLSSFMARFNDDMTQDFNISVASLFETLRKEGPQANIGATLGEVRKKVASSMNNSATASLSAAHELMLKCHVLTDIELIVDEKNKADDRDHQKTMSLLEGRLAIIGAYYNDKQYLLGIRRAAMELTRPKFSDMDISSLWLTSARLARKSDSLTQSFSAVLHASRLGDDAATIENAKLLWRDKHHRKAIQMLQGAIERNKFMTQTGISAVTSESTAGATRLTPQQKLLTARAQLLLAKWLDSAGQSNAGALREKYQQPPKTHATWEKGHFYLGHHYKKILESEKPLKVDDQSDSYVTGEIARLVIENYVRSLNAGTKYLYQTLPRVLTLWLEMGAQVDKPPEGKASLSRELARRRVEQLNLLHTFLDKYIHRLPAYIFYTALPQIVARIAHPNSQVFDRLTHMIVKVVEAHPRQALWSIIGIMTTKTSSDRKSRGTQIVQTLKAMKKVDGAFDINKLLRSGEKLAEQLLLACHQGDFQGNKTVHASLSRDLRFNHRCTPCPLVVPVENALTATLPAVTEQVRKHKAFSRDVVSIDCFLDDVLVLSSLAKPRRLTARGTDGKCYMLLIKPKDDLRTDQRLMEFNGLINRSLKRDAESSRRQLYIRTYAVVPLNEECGIIEWVPGIKTIRDILLGLYASRKIHPDYQLLRQLMDEASASESKIRVFTEDVLGRFPPIMQLWFIDRFPNPSAWFAARLRYTRSCAVMSMVGTILGLGDRHGENVNLEEGNGGVFHVDFNCLFDKGLTFAKPERVPFRLTHNMVAAMGIYGYEGPFRKSSELTLSILRQQEETLMTILEAFIYDPTLDLQKDKRAHKRNDGSVKLQPQSVVDSIKRKVRGLMGNESIPLSVEGQVEELIKQAVNPRNLTAMYIGWCPFL